MDSIHQPSNVVLSVNEREPVANFSFNGTHGSCARGPGHACTRSCRFFCRFTRDFLACLSEASGWMLGWPADSQDSIGRRLPSKAMSGWPTCNSQKTERNSLQPPQMARGSGRPPRDAESGQTCNATAVRDGTATLGPCSVSLTTRCTLNVTSHFCLLRVATPSLFFLRFIFLPVDSDGTTCVHLSAPTASELVNETPPSVCSRSAGAWQQFDQVNSFTSSVPIVERHLLTPFFCQRKFRFFRFITC